MRMTLETICVVCGMASPVTEIICQRCFSDISRKKLTRKIAAKKPVLKPGQIPSTTRILKKPELNKTIQYEIQDQNLLSISSAGYLTVRG